MPLSMFGVACFQEEKKFFSIYSMGIQVIYMAESDWAPFVF